MPAARRLAKIERGSLGVTPKFLLDSQFERIFSTFYFLTMAAITMAPGSQPASMPAGSNMGQVTHLTSPARSELSQIDPSWEI